MPCQNLILSETFGPILMLHGLGVLLLCGDLWGLGDIDWSLPKYYPIPPQYCMWDCLILIIEKFMLKSQGISQIFLSGVPLFLIMFLSTDCQKCYIAPSWHVKFWPFPGKFGPKFGFHTLRPLVMQGNFGFLFSLNDPKIWLI